MVDGRRETQNETIKMVQLGDFPFPDEILIEILSRLPVKSLLRFKCVSNTWLKLISSPVFIKQQHNQSIRNLPKIIFSTYLDTYSIDYELSPPSCYEPKPYDFPPNEFSIEGVCNGIVCLSDKENNVSLWNPATKEEVLIPYASIDEESLEDKERDVVVGFCYDPDAEEYKVVRSVFFFADLDHNDFEQCEVKICVVGTEEWKLRDNPPCRFRDRHMVPHVNGALHWLAGPPIGTASFDSKIVSFHGRNEEFGTVPWIHDGSGHDNGGEFTLGVLRNSLCMLVYKQSEKSFDIWLLKEYGVKESWTRLFSNIGTPAPNHDFRTIEPLVMRGNGEILLKRVEELYSYDAANSEFTVYDLGDESGTCYTAHIYAESLVSIALLISQRRVERNSEG